MDEAAVKRKRKRSAIACIACHDRKVRCNAASQGLPCSNCVEDGVSCDIYRRETHIPKRRRSSVVEGQPLSPSSSSATHSTVAALRTPTNDSAPEIIPNDVRFTTVTDGKPQRPDVERSSRSPSPFQTDVVTTSKHNIRPFFTGESQGLEFLFDVCSPDRPLKGHHYTTPAATYRAKRTVRKHARPAPPLPPLVIQRELTRSFFLWVWPLLPVVDAKEFLTAFQSDSQSISPLLLWSVFFAGASFIDAEVLKAQHMPHRKILKEQYYAYAKDIFDKQEEPEKTVLIQSALLLASSWYIELEDRDGMHHWIGIALGLAFSIGLHRTNNFGTISPCPFSRSLRRLWNCLWWCILYREIWSAAGFGRPLRLNSEDCDAPFPSPEEVYGDELHELPEELQSYLPGDLSNLSQLWLNFLELSLLLERVLKRHYRPRSVLSSPAQLEEQESTMLACRDRMLTFTNSACPVLAVHAAHLRTYVSYALIALYRPYLSKQLEKSRRFTSTFYADIAAKAKAAAAVTTTALNELITHDAIVMGSSMLITSMMAAMQIYVYDIRQSTGAARSYAYHQLELYMLVLTHLGKTYWTADFQHNLFNEALKALSGAPSTIRDGAEGMQEHHARYDTAEAEGANAEMDAPSGMMGHHGTFDEFLLSFNPFMGVAIPPNDLSGVDLDFNSPGSLMLDGMHQGMT
ncbi:uncharacterized protein LTR77_000107 [Saxophila tyrrhenica]|uniref:Zn(2)-C6 fungal-type domain-containing protein n=1 Tax=Saxophila tyrrhenica TaxID=1690608 RepID=A0AAV9PLU8_9PEZI|nr:hypothetical protein LTR77_000107 [Saxophila tyrrhenica]